MALTPVPFFDLRAQYPEVREAVDVEWALLAKRQSWILGDAVERFETSLATVTGAPHAVGVASGTDALLLILRALDFEPGDHVVVPDFTFFATAGAVWNAGLTPVFCDVDPATFNVTPESVEAAWTERTRAVIAVDLYGQMAPYSELAALAADRDAVVIEDAAQALGASRHGVRAGAEGIAAAHSFYPTKNVGAFGEAGAVTTKDLALAERIARLRVHGGRQMYHHEMVGTNSRLHALQAGVLNAKLPHLERWVERRRIHAAAYDAAFEGLRGVQTPAVAEGNSHSYNLYTLVVDDRDGLRAALSDARIGAGVYYPVPLHRQECFRSLESDDGAFPVANELSERVLSLPVYPELTDEQRDRVIRTVVDWAEAGS